MDDLLERLRQPDIALQGTFRGTSGPFETYIDIKPLYGLPKSRFNVMKKFARLIPSQPTIIVSCGSGGILATTIADRMYRRLTVLQEMNDGPSLLTGYVLNATNKVFIVDEVLRTGRTLRDAVTRIKETGAEIVGCGIVVQCNAVDVGAPVSHLYSIEQLLK